jgi:hypothetical protein
VKGQDKLLYILFPLIVVIRELLIFRIPSNIAGKYITVKTISYIKYVMSRLEGGNIFTEAVLELYPLRMVHHILFVNTN